MSVSSAVVPGELPASGPPSAAGVAGGAAPVPVAVDFGSGYARVWAGGRGEVSTPAGDAFASAGTLVRRGRVVNGAGCVALLGQLVARYPQPVPAGAVVVACRPVLATSAEQQAMGRVLTGVFESARVLFIDTVRAAAIGAGAAAGALLIADVGAGVTEVAVLRDGRLIGARRVDLGTRDLARGAADGALADLVARSVADLRRDPAAGAVLPAAARRGMVVVGDGALRAGLTGQLSAALRAPVHRAAAPRTAALAGARLAATAAARAAAAG